ncbi:hypothetical protein [Streptomyces sp. NPDC101455]|uniref:hypothetical protein n=1 Tax=Streptomyces sp. NPDC101455 TaxID=3366142 RepID=UPI0037F5EA3D
MNSAREFGTRFWHRISTASTTQSSKTTGWAWRPVQLQKAGTPKVIIDITNLVAPDFQGFVTPDGSSGAQQITKAAPAGAPAKAHVSAFVESPGLRPMDTGEPPMARALENVALLRLGLAAHSVRHTDFSLGVSVLS